MVTETDLRWLRRAVELSRRCPPSVSAFSVGAMIVAASGELIADGWSRRHDPHEHAEEAALLAAGLPLAPSGGGQRPAGGDTRLGGDRRVATATRMATATMYSSLEPCSIRASRPRTCTELILAAGIPRVVFVWREPEVFVDCDGAERLRAAGVMVLEVPTLAPLVQEINGHLLPG